MVAGDKENKDKKENSLDTFFKYGRIYSEKGDESAGRIISPETIIFLQREEVPS